VWVSTRQSPHDLHKFHTIAENHFSHSFTCIFYVQDNLSCKFRSIDAMAQPVAGALIANFGIESSSFGCSCEHHNICGRNVDIDTLIRFKRTTVAAGKSRNGRLVFLNVTHNHLSFSR